MKRLLLLRHAKSCWDDPELSDFDRPLAPRGEAATPRIAAYMARKLLAPELALCSAAQRTRQTWTLLAAALPAPCRMKPMRSLYLAPPSRLLTTIRRTPDGIGCLLLIGHNPGLHSLALQLAGDGKAKALARLATKFPTAALVQLDFELPNWRDIAPGYGRVVRFVRPKDLR